MKIQISAFYLPKSRLVRKTEESVLRVQSTHQYGIWSTEILTNTRVNVKRRPVLCREMRQAYEKDSNVMDPFGGLNALFTNCPLAFRMESRMPSSNSGRAPYGPETTDFELDVLSGSLVLSSEHLCTSS